MATALKRGADSTISSRRLCQMECATMGKTAPDRIVSLATMEMRRDLPEEEIEKGASQDDQLSTATKEPTAPERTAGSATTSHLMEEMRKVRVMVVKEDSAARREKAELRSVTMVLIAPERIASSVTMDPRMEVENDDDLELRETINAGLEPIAPETIADSATTASQLAAQRDQKESRFASKAPIAPEKTADSATKVPVDDEREVERAQEEETESAGLALIAPETTVNSVTKAASQPVVVASAPISQRSASKVWNASEKAASSSMTPI